MLNIFQPGLQDVIRVRAPLVSDMSAAVRNALVEGDWLKVAADGNYDVVGANPVRHSMPIIIEPSQPETKLVVKYTAGDLGNAATSGLTVALGKYVAKTNRFDTGNLGDYANGNLLVAKSFAVAGVTVYGLRKAAADGSQNHLAVAVSIGLFSNNTELRFLAL